MTNTLPTNPFETIPHELTLPRPEGKVIIDALTSAEVEEWWPIYNEPFVELNRTNPCRQNFNREEFEEAMHSPTMTKLAYIENGEIMAMCLLSNDFDHFPWMSKDFYRDQYPEKFDQGDVYYFVSLLARNDKRGMLYGSRVVKFITELFALDEKEAIITFDCCDDNSPGLANMIEFVVEKTEMGTLKLGEIGTQHYFAGQLKLN